MRIAECGMRNESCSRGTSFPQSEIQNPKSKEAVMTPSESNKINDSNPHAHFSEQVDAYLAGGLLPSERAWFEEHAAGCAPCNQLLADAAAADGALRDLFATARPAEGFEQRVVERVRGGAAAGGGRRRIASGFWPR